MQMQNRCSWIVYCICEAHTAIVRCEKSSRPCTLITCGRDKMIVSMCQQTLTASMRSRMLPPEVATIIRVHHITNILPCSKTCTDGQTEFFGILFVCMRSNVFVCKTSRSSFESESPQPLFLLCCIATTTARRNPS